MEKEKIGLSTMNWVLSIIGIILLSCVIVLPPLFRTLYKEDNEVTKEEDEVVVSTLTCYKENNDLADYIEKETLFFDTENSKLKNYSKQTERTYNDALLYQQEKPNYGKLVTAFSIITGYNYTLTPNDELSTLTITESYDLEKFKATTIVIPGDTESTEINSEYQLDDMLGIIKSKVINDGYTCE